MQKQAMLQKKKVSIMILTGVILCKLKKLYYDFKMMKMFQAPIKTFFTLTVLVMLLSPACHVVGDRNICKKLISKVYVSNVWTSLKQLVPNKYF